MEGIQERGKPPYKISNGFINSNRSDGGEQFFIAPSFFEALFRLNDISNRGEEKTPYVIDANGIKVVNLINPADVDLLKKFTQALDSGKITLPEAK